MCWLFEAQFISANSRRRNDPLQPGWTRISRGRQRRGVRRRRGSVIDVQQVTTIRNVRTGRQEYSLRHPTVEYVQQQTTYEYPQPYPYPHPYPISRGADGWDHYGGISYRQPHTDHWGDGTRRDGHGYYDPDMDANVVYREPGRRCGSRMSYQPGGRYAGGYGGSYQPGGNCGSGVYYDEDLDANVEIRAPRGFYASERD